MKPEEEVEIILWDWLKTRSENVQEVYFNRRNKLNWKVFTTSELNKKPDLIVKISEGFIAIEVKNGGVNRNIFNSFKILNIYYKNFTNGKTKYFIDNKEIKIDYFVVATQFSRFGKIFYDDTKIIDNIDKGQNDAWRKMSAKSKTLPRCEYEKTRNFLRMLWSLFRDFRNKNDSNIKPGLGILISDIIIDFSPQELKIKSGMIGKPMIEIINWKYWLKKPQWGQNIIKI